MLSYIKREHGSIHQSRRQQIPTPRSRHMLLEPGISKPVHPSYRVKAAVPMEHEIVLSLPEAGVSRGDALMHKHRGVIATLWPQQATPKSSTDWPGIV